METVKWQAYVAYLVSKSNSAKVEHQAVVFNQEEKHINKYLQKSNSTLPFPCSSSLKLIKNVQPVIHSTNTG